MFICDVTPTHGHAGVCDREGILLPSLHTAGHLRWIWEVAVFATIALLAAGCHSDGFSPPPPHLLEPPTNEEVTAQTKEIADLVTRYYANTADATQQQSIRNEIMEKTMAVIDVRFYAFDEALWKNRNISDFAFDMTNIALGFTGTIVGGAETKTVTNALVTVITGSKNAVDQDFYNQQTAMAISAKMQALRSGQAVTIISHRGDTVDKYPLFPDAVEDLGTYYRDGTVLGALKAISETAGADSTQNNNAKNVLQSGSSASEVAPSSTSRAAASQPSTSAASQPATRPSPGRTGTRSGPQGTTPGRATAAPPGPSPFIIQRDNWGRVHLYDRSTMTEINTTGTGMFQPNAPNTGMQHSNPPDSGTDRGNNAPPGANSGPGANTPPGDTGNHRPITTTEPAPAGHAADNTTHNSAPTTRPSSSGPS